jgi:isopentenyl phosphate kinase
MIFLKLGGSLITNKSRAETARSEMIGRLADEIVVARREGSLPDLLIGHGSGSFGHQAAKRYSTQLGVKGDQGWQGFGEVWAAANRLHRLMVDAFRNAGLPAISFPPSSWVIATGGQPAARTIEPIEHALQAGLIPVVHGDVVFDRLQGGAIISTEAVFRLLAQDLRPRRILLAGIEAGVYADFPLRQILLPSIDRRMLGGIDLHDSADPDVTGGMRQKVDQALALAQQLPECDIRIFSAERPGSLLGALVGERPGTQINP